MSQSDKDGRHDFDFFFGRWRSHNRKLVNHFEQGADEWVEFDASVEAGPILGGLGNVDTFSTPAFPPSGQPFEGASLRLFEPESGLWRIWWVSTTRPGHMDPPVEGRFTNGLGEFLCDDVLNGVPAKVRYQWADVSTETPRWEQAFSWDEGRTWKTNWVATFTREG
jgi:hypothetical protein